MNNFLIVSNKNNKHSFITKQNKTIETV